MSSKVGYRVKCQSTPTGNCTWYVTYPSKRVIKKSKSDILRLKIRTKSQLDRLQETARKRALKTGVQKGRKQSVHRKVAAACGDKDSRGKPVFKIECILSPKGSCTLYCNGKRMSVKALMELAGPNGKTGMKRRITNAKKRASTRAVRQGSALIRGVNPRKVVKKKSSFAQLKNPYIKYSMAAREFLVQGRPDLSVTQQSKLIAEKYNQLSSEQKAQFKAASSLVDAKRLLGAQVQVIRSAPAPQVQVIRSAPA